MSRPEEWKALNRTGYPKADPKAWSGYQREIYASLRKPILSTRFTGWEATARKKVPASNFGYVFGSAGSGETCRNNLAAFRDYRLTPAMLVNVTQRDSSVELFGHRYPSPLIMAPVGVQEIMHPDAEEASARAARKVGVPFVVSTAATRSIEQIAQASDGGDLWFQLYWPKPQYEEITASLLHRARTNGYKVLVVTLDTFSLGWRPTDLDESYLPFIEGQGCQVGFSDPVFNRIWEETPDDRTFSEKLAEARDMVGRPGTVLGALKVLSKAKHMKKARAWLDVINSETFRDWDQLEILKKLWDGPVVLKGIQSVEDAHRAIEHGASGIIVSNHGGRQLDGAMASLDALAAITADEIVQQSNMPILFDSGIRSGSDIIKALSLGAKAVLVGRPYMYGLASAGEKGVEHVLRCLLAEFDNGLANLGKGSVQHLGRGNLQYRACSKI